MKGSEGWSVITALARRQRKRMPRPPTWCSGKERSQRSFDCKERKWTAARALASKCSSVRMAILGMPEEPDVKRRKEEGGDFAVEGRIFTPSEETNAVGASLWSAAVSSLGGRRGLSGQNAAPRRIAAKRCARN